MSDAPRFCVFGAGSIGSYVGGRLLAGGGTVGFIGRARLGEALAAHGLRVTDYRGADHAVPAARIDFRTEPSPTIDADCVLVTVKSAATAEAGRALRGRLTPNAVVVSLQNGLGNAETLRAELPETNVLAGMVPFNVVARGPGHFHQGSEGALAIERHPALSALRPAFAAADLPVGEHADMRAVLWAKLLLNLNNPINALSGIPLKTELAQRGYRRSLALAQQEALRLLEQARIPLARLTPLPPRRLPQLLSVPDVVFRLLASKMLAIDPLARSSMWEDFEAGRATEIDYINGEVLRLAQTLGRRAPVNARLVELVRAAERGGRRDWRADELLDDLRRAAAR